MYFCRTHIRKELRLWKIISYRHENTVPATFESVGNTRDHHLKCYCHRQAGTCLPVLRTAWSGKTTCTYLCQTSSPTVTAEGEACNQCESCLAFNEQRSYNIHELDAASNNR